MTTIFTDDFAYRDNLDVEISIGDPQLGKRGRELCITASDTHEVRLTLTEGQLLELANQVELLGLWRKPK